MIPGGADIPVTHGNREEYLAAIIRQRIREVRPQILALARGLCTLVPNIALSFVTPAELEVCICGHAMIDVEVMRANSVVEGYNKEDKVIKMFWRILEGMDDFHRTQLVRFAWGRSRVPQTAVWARPFKIGRCEGPLPHAHTCFFQIDLPPIQDEARLRKMLMIGITYGQGGVLMS